MTAPDRLADPTDPRFTDDQRATLARFEAAPTPPEVQEARVVEEVARALENSCVDHGRCSWEHLAAAAVAAYRAAQDGGAEEAVRRVEALAVHMGGSGSSVYRKAANLIRAALAPQAGEAGL